MPVDPRFYRVGGPLSARAIADQLGLDAGTGDVTVSGISDLFSAGPEDLCFFDRRKSDWPDSGSQAGLCLVSFADEDLNGEKPYFLKCKDPRTAFFRLAETWITAIQATDVPPRIHPTAIVSPQAVIESGAVIGERTRIGPFAYIGPGVQIGRDTEISSHASVTFALVGNGVQILAGARIGEPGFGLMVTDGELRSTPHYGRVIIQDGVSIGANTCIDRGLVSDTVIGEGTKIDNLCHVGHNAIVGRQAVMAAFAGLSGSVTIGDGAQLGGRVGISDHVNVGKGARIAASAAVFHDIPDGETWGGAPAVPVRDWHRQTLHLKKIASRKGVS